MKEQQLGLRCCTSILTVVIYYPILLDRFPSKYYLRISYIPAFGKFSTSS
jgi:hypothetical protein